MNDDKIFLRSGVSDSTREIRAMTLLALPCPPLPIITTKECEGESSTTSSSGYHVGNSHDLIGHFMNIRSAVCQEGVDKKRENAQKLANDKLMNKFDDWIKSNGEKNVLPPVEVSYSYFCDFTRDYVGALMDGTSDSSGTNFIPDIRMMQPDYVRVGDPIYHSALMFAKSQDLIFGVCPKKFGVPVVDDKNCSYIDLVNLSAARIITSSS